MSSPKSLILNNLDPIYRSNFNSQTNSKHKQNFSPNNYKNNENNAKNKDKPFFNEYDMNAFGKHKNDIHDHEALKSDRNEEFNDHGKVHQKNNELFFNFNEINEIDPIFSGSFLQKEAHFPLLIDKPAKMHDLPENNPINQSDSVFELLKKNSNEKHQINRESDLREEVFEFLNERVLFSLVKPEKSFFYAKIEKRKLPFKNWAKSRKLAVFSLLSCPFDTKVAILGVISKNERLSAFYLKENLLSYLAGREEEGEGGKWEEEEGEQKEEEGKEKEERRGREEGGGRRREVDEESIFLEDNSGKVELAFKRRMKWGMTSGFQMKEPFHLNYLINGVIVMVIGELREAEEDFFVDEIIFESFSAQNEFGAPSANQIENIIFKNQKNSNLVTKNNILHDNFQTENDKKVKTDLIPFSDPELFFPTIEKDPTEYSTLISNKFVNVDKIQSPSFASCSNLVNLLKFPSSPSPKDLDSFISLLESNRQTKSLCLVISGFELDLMEDLRVFELMTFLEGSAISKKIKVIILMGNFIHEREEIKIGLKSNFIDKSGFSLMNEHLKKIFKRFSSIIEQLASFCVNNQIEFVLMPNEDDGNESESIKTKEFSKKNVYSAGNARVADTPLEFRFKNSFIFCSSALPIRNLKKHVHFQNDNEVEIIEKLLVWGNYLPIHAIFGDFNPFFDFNKNENVLIFGGCANFQFKLLKERKKEVLIVCVPGIKEKNAFVLVDMERLVCFEVGLGG